MLSIDSELLTKFPIFSEVFYVSPISGSQFPYGVSKGKVIQSGFKFLENDPYKFIPYIVVKEENSGQSSVEISNFNLVSTDKEVVYKFIQGCKTNWDYATDKLQQIKKDLNWGNYVK